MKTMVCSEDDVVQFLAGLLTGQPSLPDTITKLFSEQSLLFIGYGLKDWNIRVMLRAMRGKGEWAKSFAIQMRPIEPALASDWESSVIYWDKRENVTCFNIDALAFVEELARRYRERAHAPKSGTVT
jgi:hypothetical protein